MNKHLLSPRFVFQGVFFFASLLLLAACTNPKKDLKPKVGMINGHDYVDLDLPSGLLWATCNVEAPQPSNNGGYYAWGETSIKEDYSYKTLKYWSVERKYFLKYVTDDSEGFVDNRETLLAPDDAATMNWGIGWRTPTHAEWKELVNKRNCKWTWTMQNGKPGYLVTSKRNGNSIFLPAAGFFYDSDHLQDACERGCYWSSTLKSSSSVWNCYFGPSFYNADSAAARYSGQSIRPVATP